MERRLTTVLAIDVVGYSRLMGEDEAGTLAALKDHRKELLEPKAAQYNGRNVKLMGDGALMEFASVVDAVAFAVEVQAAMSARNALAPQGRQIVFRIGINIGDIIVEGDDIYGDGVNLAARLEGLSEPGSICIARNVFDQVKDKLDLTYDYLGEKEVKNIAAPISVYRIVMDDKAEQLVTAVEAATPRRRQWRSLVAAGVGALAVVGALVWSQPWNFAVEPVATGQSAEINRQAPSIAVLPFDNMSGDPEMEYFSDGMTEDIITELSRNPDLKVVSRNTSFTYKGKALPLRQVGEELSVRYVLEGSVRKQGDTVRITAQLIDAATDAHVWADRFDEEDTDIFALQDRVTAKIGVTLGGGEGRIRNAEYARVWKMDAAKLEEYDYYLRGHSVFFGFTPEAMLEARRIWQEGLSKFPDSGLMRVKIGWTYFQFFQFGWDEEPEKNLERAYNLVQEGLTDENLPPVGQANGHWLNALVQLYYKRDHDQALEAALKTLKITNDSETVAHISVVPSFTGKPDLAIQWAERAISREINVPEWYYLNLGLAYKMKGDCARAVLEIEKVPFVDPGKSTILADCYVQLGRPQDAKAEIARLVKELPGTNVKRVKLWLPYRDQTFLEPILATGKNAGLPE